MSVYWKTWGFNRNRPCEAGKKGYLLVKHVFANIIWRVNEPWNPTVQTKTIPPHLRGSVSRVLDVTEDVQDVQSVSLSMH